jgi:hypothetical protein
MDSNPHNPACPLTNAQIAHAADRALGLTPQPAPQTPALGRLRSIIDSLREPALEPAPETLIARLVALEGRPGTSDALDRVAAGLGDRVAGAVRLVLATLTFDSRVSPALAGFRGSASAIQLGFASEAGDVHVQIGEPDGPQSLVTIRGAFEPAAAGEGGLRDGGPPSQFLLTPVDGRGPEACGDLDEDLMFTLHVAPGHYRARLHHGGVVIDLGELKVP